MEICVVALLVDILLLYQMESTQTNSNVTGAKYYGMTILNWDSHILFSVIATNSDRSYDIV